MLERQESATSPEVAAPSPHAASPAFHELKNHLGVALLNLSLIRRTGAAGERAAHHLELIQRSLEAVSRLTEHLGSYVKQLEQPAPLELAPASVGELFEEGIGIGYPSGTPGDAELVLTGAAEVQLAVDRLAVVRLFNSLAGAALQAAGPGQTLRLLASETGDNWVHFSVEVPPRLRTDDADDVEGAVRLGLEVVARLVRAHGGSWELRQLDGGLSVAFTLPAA